jgi:hypothetical protein
MRTLFDAHSFGPRPGDRPLSPWRRDWHRHARWIGRHHWTARVVIVLMEITVAYICMVFGMVIGVGLMASF